jgi:predicted N-acyltransferase
VADAGYSAWAHQSFAWENEGYRSFEDYLARFNSNQRRNILRERRTLEASGVRVEMVPGAELAREHYDRMYAFYTRTNARFGPWGCKYLTRAFFQGLPDHFARRLVFAAAFTADRSSPVGMALLAVKGPRLYGRYWGCETDVGFLHFTACYYRPIEWAIARALRHFDPGMGGAHKLRRGFKAVANHSLHRFFDAGLRRVMEMNIEAINRYEEDEIEALNADRPLRKPQG